MIQFGIKVSEHHDTIDWVKTKNQIDFAIIRCGYGKDVTNQDDAQFHKNAEACTRLNIPFGVCMYSYAKDASDALAEAKHVLRLLQGKKLAYPVYYQLEDKSTIGQQPNEAIATIVEAFCSTLQNHDYCVGIYADIQWWQEKLIDKLYNKYSKCVVSHKNQLEYKDRCDIWQYSNQGKVDGIDKEVNVLYSYRDYAKIIPSLGKNGFYENVSEDLKNRYGIGDIVRFNHVFLTCDSKTPLKPYRNVGKITRIQRKARNPYLVGVDQGWVNEQVIEGRARYLSNTHYLGTSFSNALLQIRENASFENRRKLAALNGIANYQGTIYQNEVLLNLLKQGKLISY
jgi:Lyzozyme M1 (1,4-beta-N-acetylmuramidase)